ncbi:hypothetical protein [Stutzerimonas zhaodongensis]|uniref:hypothetical protein n=1 Tax=Stutzerimonas TaxID=2901164 RepID=UPI0038911798
MGIALATAMAASAPAFAQDGDFGVWDKDNSGVITMGEWDTGFDDENLLTNWDSNKDGMLDDNEYGEGIYNAYDADGSGDWNEEEYNAFRDDAGDGGWLDV